MASQFASRLLRTPQSWSAQNKHEWMWRMWAADVRKDCTEQICKSFFPPFSSLYGHDCVISLAWPGSPFWICHAGIEGGARSEQICSLPLSLYCRPCNTQSRLTKQNEESNTHTHTLKLGCNQGTTTNKCRGRPVPVSSHLSKASMQTNRKIKDNFVPGWWHLAEKPFGWTGPKSQWCMMNHVCWSHRCSGGPGWTQSSKLHATSFEVFGALTSGLQSHRAVSCVFHPKMVAFFDTKMVNLKGIKGTKSVF